MAPVDSPIHAAFGLTYAAYFCAPRLLLQEMPIDWQERFVELMKQLPDSPEYECRIRHKGRFVADPLADYRHGDGKKALAEITAKLNGDKTSGAERGEG